MREMWTSWAGTSHELYADLVIKLFWTQLWGRISNINQFYGGCVLLLISLFEAVGIRHNGLYSVNCVNITWQKYNGFCPPPQVFDERIL